MIDLGSRLQAAFGYAPKNSSSRLRALGFESKSGLSSSGLLRTNDGSFEDLAITGNGQELQFEFAGLTDRESLNSVFGPPPIMSYSKRKNLTITEIDGSDAEVVERYGDRSWEIKIRGLLIDMSEHQFPKKKVELIRKLFDTPAPFEVRAELFDALNIKSIYFTSIDIETVAGFEDTISFTMEARSIKPVEFRLA